MKPSSPEKGLSTPQAAEKGGLVLQPHKAENLALLVAEINDLPSENTGSGPSNDWSAGGGAMVQTSGTQTSQPSARDQAIAQIPVVAIMQKQLEAHIRNEVKDLRKQARQIIRSRKPGSAHALAQLYAKMRHLNALLADLLEASYDVLKRLFVKVFVDKQSIQ